MSVRNIRAHQARGLLAPPEVRTRVGYYGPEHVAQLRLIRALQADGFNLGGIKRLLEDTQGTAERLPRFKDALRSSAPGERPQRLTLAQLGRRFRVSTEEAPEVLAKARKLGVLVRVSDEEYEAPSPSLLAIAEEAVKRGISLHSALSLLEEIERHCDSVSRAFVKLFLREVSILPQKDERGNPLDQVVINSLKEEKATTADTGPKPRDWGSRFMGWFRVGFDSDQGLLLGGVLDKERYAFRQIPYRRSTRHGYR